VMWPKRMRTLTSDGMSSNMGCSLHPIDEAVYLRVRRRGLPDSGDSVGTWARAAADSAGQ